MRSKVVFDYLRSHPLRRKKETVINTLRDEMRRGSTTVVVSCFEGAYISGLMQAWLVDGIYCIGNTHPTEEQMHRNVHRFQGTATYTPQYLLSVCFGRNRSSQAFYLLRHRKSSKSSKARKDLPLSSVVSDVKKRSTMVSLCSIKSRIDILQHLDQIRANRTPLCCAYVHRAQQEATNDWRISAQYVPAKGF